MNMAELYRVCGWPISQLGLTRRAHNCLRGAEITTVAVLVWHTERDIRAIPNVGKKTMEEITSRLRRHDLRLGMGDNATVQAAMRRRIRDLEGALETLEMAARISQRTMDKQRHKVDASLIIQIVYRVLHPL